MAKWVAKKEKRGCEDETRTNFDIRNEKRHFLGGSTKSMGHATTQYDHVDLGLAPTNYSPSTKTILPVRFEDQSERTSKH
jgi:hypothetical protein